MMNNNNKKYFLISFLTIFFLAVFIFPSPTYNHLLQAMENTSQQKNQKKIESSNQNNPQSLFQEENISKQTNLEENNSSSAVNKKQMTEKKTEKATEEMYPLFNPQNIKDGKYRTQNNFTLLIEDGIASIDGIKIVNKSIPVSETVASSLSPETEEAFLEMQEAISKEKMYIKIVSGYRNYATQEALYANYLANDNKKNTETYSARPGHSEHHLGEAVDIGSDRDLSLIKPQYPQSKWLEGNCYKYGFILRYPENKQEYTGFICEPWHFRYVGKDLAKILYNNGDWITLEEYYGLPSEYLE